MTTHPQDISAYYRTLERQFAILDAIKPAERTNWQQQQHTRLKASIEDAGITMALREVTA